MRKLKRKLKSLRSRKENAKGTCTVSIFDFIPDEILHEILSYLSVDNLSKASAVSKRWYYLVDTISKIDLTIVCDITGSANYFSVLTNCLKKLKATFNEKKVRLGFVGFRDHEEDYSDVCIFETGSPGKVIRSMLCVRPEGGNDYPEAVLDGINTALNFPWRLGDSGDSRSGVNKHIILFCDAPPHGSQFCSIEMDGDKDNFPDGCPCGLNEVSLLNKVKQNGINFHFVDVSGLESLTQTYQLFANVIPHLKYTKIKYGKNVSTLEEQLSEILCGILNK